MKIALKAKAFYFIVNVASDTDIVEFGGERFVRTNEKAGFRGEPLPVWKIAQTFVANAEEARVRISDLKPDFKFARGALGSHMKPEERMEEIARREIVRTPLETALARMKKLRREEVQKCVDKLLEDGGKTLTKLEFNAAMGYFFADSETERDKIAAEFFEGKYRQAMRLYVLESNPYPPPPHGWDFREGKIKTPLPQAKWRRVEGLGDDTHDSGELPKSVTRKVFDGHGVQVFVTDKKED